MTRFTFSQTDWKLFVFSSVLPVILYRILQNYVGTSIAILLGFVIGVIAVIWFSKYLSSTVNFKDAYLVFKDGPLKEEIKIDYTEVNKITYLFQQMKKLEIKAGNKIINVPPPARLDKAEELFNWLIIQNPAIQVEVIK